MMYGTRDEFPYWECAACGCLQLTAVPESMARYYPDDYYSFRDELTPLDRWFYRAYFAAPGFGALLRKARGNPYFADQKFQAVVAARLKRGARILDVGCGGGELVSVLRTVGFDAHGVDPYTNVPSPFVRRGGLDEEDGNWDLIMFHHSLEHMADHASVLRRAGERLNPGGVCLVRIPVANWAWKHYGKDWVQLDPPRHLIIHTPASFRLVAEQSGFRVEKVIFDSTVFQFLGSEFYQQDIPLTQQLPERLAWTKQKSREFYARAVELNRQELGDQASFYLRTS